MVYRISFLMRISRDSVMWVISTLRIGGWLKDDILFSSIQSCEWGKWPSWFITWLFIEVDLLYFQIEEVSLWLYFSKTKTAPIIMLIAEIILFIQW